MDNYRVPRRPVLPRQAVDGFAGSKGRTQTPESARAAASWSPRPAQPNIYTTGVNPSLQNPQQQYTEASSVPVQQETIPVPTDEPQRSVPQKQAWSPIDIASIEEVEKPKNRLSAGHTFRRWMLRGGLAMFAVLLAVGGVLFAQGYSKVHKVFKGTAGHAAALQSQVDPKLLKGEGDGRVNFLLLGNGGGGHDAPDLTDTLIIESVDPVNKTATLLSVPRDLWVQVPNYGSMKINAAYEVGKYNYLHKIDNSNANTKAVEAGFALADQVIESVVGIPIHYNMLVNFASFKQAVDSVGGVTVNVPAQLYDPTMAWENHNNPVLAQAGVQQMNGIQALLYVRSRETSSDFARSQRQRSVMVALKDKVLTAGTLSNPIRISQLMNAFGNNMVTDISLDDASRAYDIVKNISNDKILSLDLVTPPHNLITTGNMNNVSIDQPRAGLYQYADIQSFVRSALKDGYLVNENAQITVLNGTKVAGLGGRKADELKTYGYNIAQVGNAPTQTYAKTVVVDLTNGASKYTKHYLENRYGVTAVTQVPDPAIQPGSANFIVIIGADQAQ